MDPEALEMRMSDSMKAIIRDYKHESYVAQYNYKKTEAPEIFLQQMRRKYKLQNKITYNINPKIMEGLYERYFIKYAREKFDHQRRIYLL